MKKIEFWQLMHKYAPTIYEIIRRNVQLYKSKSHVKYSNAQIEKHVGLKYKNRIGRTLNWDEPLTYTEKLNVSKVYNANQLKTKLTDKYEVREWVKHKIGEEYLIPLIGSYTMFDEIDFSKLPDKFVMKCNHDSGSVTICNDKEKLNIKDLREKYNFYMKRNEGYMYFEMHYVPIVPKILIEKNMGENLRDYKFLCFNGKPYYCWVDLDRYSGHKRFMYDLEWNLQPFTQYTYNPNEIGVEKPKSFNEMIKIVNVLCQGFDHVRVDLYEINGKPYFGEMTFTNGDGMERIVPDKYDYYLGSLWEFESRRLKK